MNWLGKEVAVLSLKTEQLLREYSGQVISQAADA